MTTQEVAPQVLIIDDDEAILTMVLELLKRSGHSAIGTPDPQHACQLIGTTPSLKLLVSDVDLRSTTGPAVIRKGMKNRPDLGVIFMTGGVGETRIRNTDPVLNKPFSIVQFCAVVEHVIETAPILSERRSTGPERRRLVR
jgi:DNA-binding NtrC family response regulator